MREKAIAQYNKTLELLKNQDETRETGIYYVRFRINPTKWTVLCYDGEGQCWLNFGVEDLTLDHELDEIGPKIEMPS